ncbi:TolC family protein [Cytophagaceae bacterium YF14B1]|nr:TolC family protein [Xanthocytophaga flavus]MDJ1472713.1 TolC family protein [Xanthocytophaga flavus]MDJ1482340.1 TolC family protein [Xanthocytophaga flavus]
MKTLKKAALTGLLALSINSIQAQSQAQKQINNDDIWSLREAVDYAMQNSITIKKSELQARTSEVTYFQSKMAFLPTITGNGSLQWNFGRYVDPTTNQFVNQTTQTGNYGISGNVLLFQGGQQIHAYKQNQRLYQATQEDIEQSKYNVSLNVALYYLQVLQNQELVAAATSQLEVSRLQVERTDKLVKAGSLPQTNLFDLQAQLANDQLSLTTAENNLRLAKLNLMQAMNLPAQDNFEVEKIELPDPTINPYPQTAANIYDEALRTQPSVKAADIRVESSKYSIMSARGYLFPRLYLSAGLNTYYSSGQSKYVKTGEVYPTIGNVTVDGVPYTVTSIQKSTTYNQEKYSFGSQISDNLGQYVGFSLSIPIINGWQYRNNISKTIVQRKSYELDAQSTRVTLRQNIEQAYNDLRAAASQYQANRDQVAAQDLSFKSNEARFSAGLANSLDYNTSKNNLARAQANLINSKYTYYFRVKILDFYQNKPLTFE